jgi:molybdenum cofactor cytidylyltransferase
MGRSKLLLPWGDTSILGHQIDAWRQLGAAQVGVVYAAGDEGIIAELDRLAFPSGDRIVNPRPEDGMFGSVRCAARWSGWKAELSHSAITLGDQPHLRTETLQAVLELSRAQPDRICQPRVFGHLRHPVAMPVGLFQQLRDTKASTLKEFLASQEVVACEVNDAGLELDIDTPEDYERALRLCGMKTSASNSD